MQKIKVLHIIKSLGRGGAEMLLPETLKVHNKTDFEFHYIYFLPWKDQMVGEIRSAGGTINCIAANNNLQLISKYRAVSRYVRENNIDIIHAHLPWAGIVARIVGKRTGVPVIYSEHNKQERYHFATRFLNLRTMPWLRTVVAVSQDVSDSIQKHRPRLSVPVKTILNGVNTNDFIPDRLLGKDIREKFNIPADAFVVGTVAVFRFQKRLDLWLEIAKQLLDEKPESHFIIVGDGPLKELIQEKTKSLQLTDKVHFAGLQTDVKPYFNAFDLYMMSSVFEGLPIALLEAMSCGVPVVATAAGGIKEVIRNGVDGLLCEVDEPYRLKELALELMINAGKRKLLGENGRLRVKSEFSIETMVKQLETLYRNTIG